jgi:APA family basic amino acid/polyamine antiporter
MRQLLARKPLARIMKEAVGGSDGHTLHRVLSLGQLTALGIGAIIGAGIFVLTGVGAHDKAGPALILSFVVSGTACIFAGLCYAELAAMLPVAGSAYTYAYATLGEMAAWIIGWNLIFEYTFAAASVAHGWSHYLQDFLGIFGLKLPYLITNAPFDFSPETGRLLATGTMFDFPAIAIAVLLSALLVVGIKESTRVNAAVVALKVLIVLFIIAVGAFYVKPSNWVPFAPFGYGGLSLGGHVVFGRTGPGGDPVGMLAGAAVIFFAYIGFDALSTQAEEAENPQRDVPLSILFSLLICTVLYIAVTAVLTGMVPYDQIDIDAPVSAAFKQIGLPWAQFLVSIGALAGLTSVSLVMILGQSRIFMSMARDGLLPRFFSAIHPKFRTPWKSTILTGSVVAILAGLIPLRVLAELVNIGTLLAFAIVCLGLLVLRKSDPGHPRPFRCPWVPLVPTLGILSCLVLMFSLPAATWLRLLVWIVIGLMVYALYGRSHSALRAH